MPNTVSYALFPLANHRMLSTTTLLCTASRLLSQHCTDKTLWELQYVSTEIQKKSSRIKHQSSDNRSSLLFCVYTDSFGVVFCTFLLEQQQLQQQQGSSHNDHRKLNRHYLKELTQRLQATDGIHQMYSITYLMPSAPVCYVRCLTGNKRNHNEETW